VSNCRAPGVYGMRAQDVAGRGARWGGGGQLQGARLPVAEVHGEGAEGVFAEVEVAQRRHVDEPRRDLGDAVSAEREGSEERDLAERLGDLEEAVLLDHHRLEQRQARERRGERLELVARGVQAGEAREEAERLRDGGDVVVVEHEVAYLAQVHARLRRDLEREAGEVHVREVELHRLLGPVEAGEVQQDHLDALGRCLLWRGEDLELRVELQPLEVGALSDLEGEAEPAGWVDVVHLEVAQLGADVPDLLWKLGQVRLGEVEHPRLARCREAL